MSSPRQKSKQRLKRIAITWCGCMGFVWLMFALIYGQYNVEKTLYKRASADELFNYALRDIYKVWRIPSAMPDGGWIVVFGLLFILALITLTQILNMKARMNDGDNALASSHFLGEYDHSEIEEYNKTMVSPIGSPKTNGADNIILAKDLYLSMDCYKTKVNLNQLWMGGSGSGKTRSGVGPNILQANANYIVTDPSGEILTGYGKFLENNGYKVSVFNLVDLDKSNKFNPIVYANTEEDVFDLVDTFLANTKAEDEKSGEKFWDDCTKLILQAIILYLKTDVSTRNRPETHTFNTVVQMLNKAKVDENNSEYESDLDRLFLKLEADEGANCLAVQQYKAFKQAAGKTLKSILISALTRVEKFMIEKVADLTSTDEFHFDKFADSKQALFIITPTGGGPFDFLCAMMYTEIFKTLYRYGEDRVRYSHKVCLDDIELYKVYQAVDKETSAAAKKKAEKYASALRRGCQIVYNQEKELYELYAEGYKNPVTWRGSKKEAEQLNERIKAGVKVVSLRGNRIPMHTRCLMDEFANIKQIPKFDKIISTTRKYNISIVIVLQGLAQIKANYPKDWSTIISNCNETIFLGTQDSETIKAIIENLGKEERKVADSSWQANGGSSSVKKHAVELMTIDQVTTMNKADCIVIINGQYPVKTKKYILEEHPRYEEMKATEDCFVIRTLIKKRSGVFGQLSEEAQKRNEVLENIMENTISQLENNRDKEAIEEVELSWLDCFQNFAAAKTSARNASAKCLAEQAKADLAEMGTPEQYAQDTLDRQDELARRGFNLPYNTTTEEAKEKAKNLITLHFLSADEPLNITEVK